MRNTSLPQQEHREQLFKAVRKYCEMSDADLVVVAAHSHVAHFHAGEFFLKPGQVCYRGGMVLEGVFRIFSRDENGEEVTKGLPGENSFVFDFRSYQNRTSVSEHWVALTPVKMLMWEQSDIEYLERHLPTWTPVINLLMQQVLLSVAIERTEMFGDDASARYQKFMERYPEIIARVPLRHIANYLGIAPQSLSRIRRQVGKR